MDWRGAPVRVLVPWMLGALAVTGVLLLAVLVIAAITEPDPSGAAFPGVSYPASGHDFAFVLYRNGLVLALHALACVAGFMAGSALPTVATGYSGTWRKIHDRAGPLAIGFVITATLFSLSTQAYALGRGTADLSGELGLSPPVLLLGLLPHALPELDRAVPPAGRVDARRAPRGMAGTARGHLRDGRDRGPDPDRGGGRGDVGLAGPPSYTF